MKGILYVLPLVPMAQMMDHNSKLRVLPKWLFKKKIKIVLFNILESEDLYDDFESLVTKVNHN